MSEFISDLAAIRERARRSIEDGAVTGGYKGDREQVIKVLNEALATELVCILRYKRHYYMAKGMHAEAVKPEFLQHAGEEQQHADWLAQRITQLGARRFAGCHPFGGNRISSCSRRPQETRIQPHRHSQGSRNQPPGAYLQASATP